MVTHMEASKNILSYIDEGRLVQKTWSSEDEGRHIGCLLHAAAGITDTSSCPAHLMPAWMAHCTVTLFDGLAIEDVKDVSTRYASLIGRWAKLAKEDWDNVLARWLV